eukprot:794793-Pyramimonas_sp.AAC.1
MSNRRLDEDLPASPAPGAALSPRQYRTSGSAGCRRTPESTATAAPARDYREQPALGKMTTPVSCSPRTARRHT